MPINYAAYQAGIRSPVERALAGYQQGLQVQQYQQQQQLQAEKLAEQRRQAKELQTDLGNLSAIENPSVNDYLSIVAKHPSLNNQFKQSIEMLGAEEKEITKQRALNVFSALNAGQTDIAKGILMDYKTAAENSGKLDEARSMDIVLSAIDLDPKSAKDSAALFLASTMGEGAFKDYLGKIQGGGRGTSEKPFAPITVVNKATGEKQIVIPTFDPDTGKARVEKADLPEGFVISKETEEEKRQADVLASREKELQKITGKGVAERTSAAIDKGLSAAEGYSNLARARDLLDTVKTGGIDAVSLRAKQLFGVEAANEAELSNKLSKAVLSQLKATFGAQFTVEEGRRLERIEARFGKSTEGNKRLLEQTMKLVERAAQRGIRAAKRAGDEDAAEDIQAMLEFRLEEPQQVKMNTAEAYLKKIGR